MEGSTIYYIAPIIGALLLFFTFVTKLKIKINSIKQVFILGLIYYTTASSVDEVLGITELARGFNRNYPDLETQASINARWTMLLHAALLAIGFFAPYLAYKPQTASIVPLPPTPNDRLNNTTIFIITIDILLTCLFLYHFNGFNKQAILLGENSHLSSKIIREIPNILLALNALAILRSASVKKTTIILIFAGISALTTDNRTNVVYYILLAAIHHKATLPLVKTLLIAVCLFAFLTLSKGLYANLQILTEKNPNQEFQANPFRGFSGIEASDADGIYLSLLSQGSSPLLLGESYFHGSVTRLTPTQTEKFKTLAQQYGNQFNPTLTEKGGGIGFSGIAESWLNFGAIGPLIIGILLGSFCMIAEQSRNKIILALALIITMRFFRSDFLSLFKTWVCAFGTYLIFSHFLLEAINTIKRSNIDHNINRTQ